MRTRDGVRLDADVYRPAGGGDHPVLLMRQPYGRRIATTVCYAHPAWYAAQGYVVVIQDVRGRGTSEGDFTLFAQEGADGADAITWAAALPGSTGAVGMYGFSYQGVTQLMAAAERPAALRAVAPAMIGWDLRQDWAWSGGAFPLAANLSWSVQIAAQEARRRGDGAAFAELAEAARSLPIGRDCHARPVLLERHAALVPHHALWRDLPFDDPYWARISPAAHTDALTAGPGALFVSGWYDSHLTGTVAAYRAYEAAGAQAELVVGPWAHFPWGRRTGGQDFGDAAIGDIDRQQLHFFDRHLKRIDHPRPADPVRLFDVGAACWRSFPAWPQATESWGMASNGRAALDERDGYLAPTPESDADAERLVHDPWRPVPTVGGALGLAAGPLDRTDVDARPDVLTYTSAPLDAPLALAGEPVVVLDVQADRPSFDVSCVLGRVDVDGRSTYLSEGYVHLASAPNGPVRLTLRPLCATIPAGERLRLSVAGASFPAFPVNPGTGARPVDAPVIAAEVITQRLGLADTRLMLPLAR